MSNLPSLRPLFSFSGWVVQDIKLNAHLAVVTLRRHRHSRLLCPDCNQTAGENRRIWQTAKDLPLGSATTVLIIYQAIQGRCSRCKKYFTITPNGIDHRAKATDRLMHHVYQLCQFMPADKVPFILPISDSTVRRWEKKISSCNG